MAVPLGYHPLSHCMGATPNHGCFRVRDFRIRGLVLVLFFGAGGLGLQGF